MVETCILQVTNHDLVTKSLSWLESIVPESQEEEDDEVLMEEEEEEDGSQRVRNKEFWLATKHQLQNILDLLSEVQQISCHCHRPDCPFQDCTSPSSLSPLSGSPRTSPTCYRRHVSYGGFEGMIRSEDVVHDHKEEGDPTQMGNGSFRRGTPVVRKKKITVPSMSGSDQSPIMYMRSARHSEGQLRFN